MEKSEEENTEGNFLCLAFYKEVMITGNLDG